MTMDQDAVARLVEASRASQGFPPHLEDAAALKRIAAALARPEEEAA